MKITLTSIVVAAQIVAVASNSLLVGCRRPLLSLGLERSGRPIVLIGAGQSNATDPTLWIALCTQITEYTGAPCEYHIVAFSATTSTMWANDVNGMRTALALAVKQYHPDFICWLQGEGDGDQTADSYAANVAAVINASRQYAADRMLWSVALRHYQGYNYADVRGGQRLLVAERLAIQGADADSFQTPELTRDNGLHFNAAGQRAIAGAWFKTLIPFLH